jgi:hypothetical protein
MDATGGWGEQARSAGAGAEAETRSRAVDGARRCGELAGRDDVRHASMRAVQVLLEELPEAGPSVAGLVEDFDDGLSAHSVFAELAAITSQLLERSPTDEEDEDLLERIFSAIEVVTTTRGVDVVTTVAYGFLDQLSLSAYDRALPYFGAATERLAVLLDQDALELDEDEDDDDDDEDDEETRRVGR